MTSAITPRGEDAFTLTPRRRAILVLAANGLTNARIGHRLHLSEEAVKSHVRVIYQILGARDRAHAVALGIARGVIRLHEIDLTDPAGCQETAGHTRTRQ